MTKIDDIIKCRQCIRQYSNKPVNWGKLSLVLEAATHAPCAGGISTVKLIVVSDHEKKKSICDACQQDFVGKASFLIIVCSETSQTGRFYGERAKIYLRQQAGAAIQNMLLKATDLDLACCWVGAFNEEFVKKELKIPIDVQVEAIIPIANALKQPTTKLRKAHIDLKKIVFFGSWRQTREKMPKTIEAL